MEREFYLSFEGKDARIFLQSPRPMTREVKRVSPNNLDLTAVRITNGINTLEASEETIEAMRKGDPEIDLQTIGGILDTTTRAYYDADSKEVRPTSKSSTWR